MNCSYHSLLVNFFLQKPETIFTPSRLYGYLQYRFMSKDEVSIIGKPVKDMYGTTIGNVLGTLTHIDGCYSDSWY